MDIEQLKAFVAIARKKSFSLAGEALYLTQPAISKRLATLESELKTPLIDRVSRNIKLTQAGETLLPRAEAILLELTQAKKAVADLEGGVRGELRVATSHHLGLHKLPPVLRQYCARYPEVNLRFEFLDSEVALSRVTKGACELAVITLPPNTHEALEFQTLWADPLQFVTHPNSTLADHLSLKDLSHEPAILPDLNTYTGRLVKSCFDAERLPLLMNMTTNYLETIKMMVSVGLGWSVLPQSMFDNQLRELQVHGVTLSRSLGVVKHKRRHLNKAAQAFYEMLYAEAFTHLEQ